MTPGLGFVERHDSNVVILAVRGIVDMAAAPALADQIRAILHKRPPTVVIDLLETTFLATAGMSILMEANRRSEELAISFRVVAGGRVTVKPMQLLGIDVFFALYPTVDAALRGLTAGEDPTRDNP